MWNNRKKAVRREIPMTPEQKISNTLKLLVDQLNAAGYKTIDSDEYGLTCLWHGFSSGKPVLHIENRANGWRIYPLERRISKDFGHSVWIDVKYF